MKGTHKAMPLLIGKRNESDVMCYVPKDSLRPLRLICLRLKVFSRGNAIISRIALSLHTFVSPSIRSGGEAL